MLKLRPHLAPRPWGGTRLGSVLGKDVPEGEKFGESWELSDHPDGPSRVQGGPFDGRLFGEIVREHPVEMIGVEKAPEKFPLLIKYIDAAEDLSIQVHPDDAYCAQNGLKDRGKTECWFILDCEPDSEVIFGLKPGVDRNTLQKAIADQTVADVVQRIPIRPGDFLFTPAGAVHALLGGTLLCEIQQSSNLTYRLWDWNRKPARPLHVEEALEVIRFQDNPLPESPLHPDPAPKGTARLTTLTENRFFSVCAAQIDMGQTLDLEQPGQGFILNGVDGCIEIDDRKLLPGNTYFVPACVSGVTLQAKETPAMALVTISNELG